VKGRTGMVCLQSKSSVIILLEALYKCSAFTLVNNIMPVCCCQYQSGVRRDHVCRWIRRSCEWFADSSSTTSSHVSV